MQVQTNLKLGYWPIRGKAQLPRLLLAYSHTPWQDVLYTNPDTWFQQDKQTLPLEFPNLPYLINHQLKITESQAIIRYIVEKYANIQLLGKTLQDRAKVNMLLGVLEDVRNLIGSFMLDKQGYKDKMATVYEQIKPKLEMMEQFFKNKVGFTMGYLTVADFQIAQTSYYIQSVYPQHYEKYSFLQRIRQRFNSIPQIKDYYSRPDSIKWPFVTPSLAAIQIKCDDINLAE